MAEETSVETYNQVIVDISYEAVVCAIKALAHTATMVRENLGKLQGNQRDSKRDFLKVLQRIVGELISSIDSLITRSKNAPLYAYTWGLPLTVFTEASRIDDYRAYRLVENIITCSPPDENTVLYRGDNKEKLEFLSSTNFGYSLHLGILAHIINKLKERKLVDINRDEIKSMHDLLSVVREHSRDTVFESIVLEALSIVSKIVPALLNTLSDKYEVYARRPREELPCILKEITLDLDSLVKSLE